MSRVLHSRPYAKLRRLMVAARASANLTQAEVAATLKRPQSFVSKYESGERHLDVIEFVEVCRALGVSPAAVMSDLVE